MLKVGDKIIFTKNISDLYNVKGSITEISYKYEEIYFYRVNFYREDINHIDSCNIFNHSGESIELDVQYYRDKKLTDLGI